MDIPKKLIVNLKNELRIKFVKIKKKFWLQFYGNNEKNSEEIFGGVQIKLMKFWSATIVALSKIWKKFWKIFKNWVSVGKIFLELKKRNLGKYRIVYGKFTKNFKIMSITCGKSISD